MNNILTDNNKKNAFEAFMKGTIEVPERLPEGTHSCIFNGIDFDLERSRVIIKFKKDNKEHKDIRKFNPEKPEALTYTLAEIARQFGINGMFTPTSLNEHIGKELTVYATIPEGFKTVMYNYKEIFRAAAEPTTEEVIDGQDF